MAIKICSDCRDGEHDNYDDDVKFVTVTEKGTKGFFKRAYLCKEHRESYIYDGYIIKSI